MAGGLLNIIAQGNANIFLTGNPSKTFFRVTYSKYTNFGLQKFRLDYNGIRDLRLTEPSTFTFKVKRYADLLMDTYLVVSLPDIWSPISTPSTLNNYRWIPYEFRWDYDDCKKGLGYVKLHHSNLNISKNNKNTIHLGRTK
jgi:hypothetical protein